MRKLNISIDDVSPHPLSSIKVVDQCFRIITEFPDAKFTLFVPTAYWRTVLNDTIDTRTSRPLYLKEHPAFCQRLIDLPTENFEVGFHGRYHGLINVSNNDEFRYIGGDQAVKLFDAMKSDVCDAGLTHVFKPLFRPPAFYISSDALMRLHSCQFLKVFALSTLSHHKDRWDVAAFMQNVVYMNVSPPDMNFDDVSKSDDIEALYHACTWDRNYLDAGATDNIIDWLHKNPVEFSFLEDLVREQTTMK